MKEEIKIFNQYVKQFDLREKAIMNKYHHSFRVMEFCKEIALSLNLNEQDIYIACLCGLLHDIARFEQWTQYHTYRDEHSFDHGDYGYEILKKDDFIKSFTKDEEIKSIVLQSVKHHNKLTVPSLNERELLFAQMVRDADKLDIMKEQGNKITSNEIVLNSNL